MSSNGRAIVCHDTHASGGWKMEDVTVRAPGEGELLVQMIASGVCHTDALIGGIPDGAAPIAFYPRVLGHEGSGYVKEVGPGVTVAAKGDPVLLSYGFCDTCEVCKRGHRSHCVDFNGINFGGPHKIFGCQSWKDGEQSIGGAFFGQSSFASTSIVKQCSVVNAKDLIKSEDELKLFSPLGCGIMTGSGSVLNTAEPGPEDTIVIMGLGGVGLSAVMGAKIAGCKKIIGIDRVASRLKMAQELGCTDVLDGSNLPDGKDLITVVKDLTSGLGPNITVDTTGAPPLIKAGTEFTRNRGKYVQVGSAPFDFNLEVSVFSFMVRGLQFIGAVEGQAYPPEFLPKLIAWYREGKFPLDKMMKLMPAAEFERALQEMHTGETIKPILCW
ncbi:hypothetical protein MBLNU230_g6525t1 [Neophaeotheca triangularis]